MCEDVDEAVCPESAGVCAVTHGERKAGSKDCSGETVRTASEHEHDLIVVRCC